MTILAYLPSLTFALCQITAGLLLHPYQTMQSLVRDKVFVWMSLLPTAILAVVTIFWRFLLVPLVRLVFSCSSSNFIVCYYLSFFSNIVTFFCIYWQVILLYLLVRFSRSFR